VLLKTFLVITKGSSLNNMHQSAEQYLCCYLAKRQQCLPI